MPQEKPTSLDEEITQAWDTLVFPRGQLDSGPLDNREEYEAWTANRLPLWIKLLDKCREGETWIVNSRSASLISSQLWFSYMTLRKYREAAEIMAHCLEHPGPFDRVESAEFPIWHQVARLGVDPYCDAPTRLEELIDCDVYGRSKMAMWIARGPLALLEDFPTEDPIPSSLNRLAVALAEARKRPKKTTRACEAAHTWRELIEALNLVAS